MQKNVGTTIKKDKKEKKFKLIVNNKEYKHVSCSRDVTTGKRYCVFERRNGFSMERIKVGKDEIEIDYGTGTCLLKKVI